MNERKGNEAYIPNEIIREIRSCGKRVGCTSDVLVVLPSTRIQMPDRIIMVACGIIAIISRA
jgi:hypothetical protein